MSVLFFKPIARPAIWGKTLVRDYFHYDDFPEGIGQSWSFSAQEGASTVCTNREFEGKTLLELWNHHPELFNSSLERFPVIISLVGPEDDLSIQIHPDDTYAKKIGYASGKNEAWYFIESKENANIVYGHNAKDEADMRAYIARDDWNGLIRHLDVHTGDFVYLPAGLLHALRAGSVVYEIQQATDITYRFYDYHRKDAQGKERELHLEQAIACMSYDQEMMKNHIEPKEDIVDHAKITTFISNTSFTVKKVEINGKSVLPVTQYLLATVVRGNGKVDGTDIQVGDNFLVPANLMSITLEGDMDIMITCE